MKCDKKNLLLYAVTDRSWLGDKTLAEQTEEALHLSRSGKRNWTGNISGRKQRN